MAAYGVIGGAIGGAIAIALAVWLQKRLIKREKKKKAPQGNVSYRPGATWFAFLVLGIGGVASGAFALWYTIVESFNIVYLGVYIYMSVLGILAGCWSGSFLCAKITISKDRLIIDRAAKMPIRDRHIHIWQLGRYHLNVNWCEIQEIRGNINWMRVHLYNGECYTFPIGWCKEKARAAVARHMPMKPWE